MLTATVRLKIYNDPRHVYIKSWGKGSSKTIKHKNVNKTSVL